MYPFKNKSLYGIIDSSGSVVLEADRFDRIGFFEGASTVYSVRGELGGGIWRDHLEFRAPDDAYYLFDISDSLCLAKDENYRCGYVGLTGDWEIEKKFFQGGNFRMGYASVCVEKGGKFGLLNKSAEIVAAAEYDHIDSFTTAGAPARKGRRWYLIRPDLTAIDCGEVDRIYGPSEGLMIRMTKSGKGRGYDYLDLDLHPAFGGKRFQDARRYSEGRCGVKINNKGFCVIDSSGEMVVDNYFSDLGSCYRGVMPAKELGKGGWGAINLSGEWIIPPMFEGVDHVIPFSNDNSRVGGEVLLVWSGDFVADNGGMGYYDYDGNVVRKLNK